MTKRAATCTFTYYPQNYCCRFVVTCRNNIELTSKSIARQRYEIIIIIIIIMNSTTDRRLYVKINCRMSSNGRVNEYILQKPTSCYNCCPLNNSKIENPYEGWSRCIILVLDVTLVH